MQEEPGVCVGVLLKPEAGEGGMVVWTVYTEPSTIKGRGRMRCHRDRLGINYRNLRPQAEDTPLGARPLLERLGHWDGHTDPGPQELGARGPPRVSAPPVSAVQRTTGPFSVFLSIHGTAGPGVPPGRVSSLHCPSLSFSGHP